MAFCTKCGGFIPGEYVPGDIQYCIHCSPTIADQKTGAKTEKFPSVEIALKQRPKNDLKRFATAALFIVVTVFAVVFLANAGYLTYLFINDRNDSRHAQIEQKTPSQEISTPLKKQIVKTRVVGRFVLSGASQMITINRSVQVRVIINGSIYDKVIGKKGWYSNDLPCGNDAKILYGDTFEFQQNVDIPCQANEFIVGLFTWDTGVLLGDDMDTDIYEGK